MSGRRLATLVSLGGAALAFLVGVFLIPAAIDDRAMANRSLTAFGIGFALVIVAVILGVRGQESPAATTGSPAAYRFGRIATLVTWVITVPHILLLGAFALLALVAGALDDPDEAWDILYPQAITAILLSLCLLILVPRKVPPEAPLIRRLGVIVPITIIIAFWSWQSR